MEIVEQKHTEHPKLTELMKYFAGIKSYPEKLQYQSETIEDPCKMVQTHLAYIEKFGSKEAADPYVMRLEWIKKQLEKTEKPKRKYNKKAS